MSKVYAFMANGLEEVECLAAVDVMRRAGVEVTLVSISKERTVVGAHHISIVADALFEEVNCDEADLLFLPGGMPGTINLSQHEGVIKLLCKFNEEGKRLAAICAAPSVLGQLGLLDGKSATCYPGFGDKLIGATYMSRAGVVTDGNVTTARGLGYALDLGLEIVELLCGPEKADEIKNAIQYDK